MRSHAPHATALDDTLSVRAARSRRALERPGFVHTALLHRSTWELIGRLVPVVSGWLARRDRVFVNLAPERLWALRAALGADADRIRWSDTYQWVPHPARRLRAVQELFEGEERHGCGRLRFVGECAFPAGPPELVAEWERFDAVLNDALCDAAATMVCTYDTSTLPEGVTSRVACTHPFLGVGPVVANERHLSSLEFLAPRRALAPLPEAATGTVGRPSPAEARSLVRRVLLASTDGGGSHPPHTQAVENLAVVATELVTNAWQVDAQTIGVSCWRSGGEVGVQVDDDGPGLDDVLAGYRRPAAERAGGRGLWIVRQLADLVEIAPHGTGTSVRARVFERQGVPAGSI